MTVSHYESPIDRQIGLFAREDRFDDGIAEIIERKRALTASDDLKTAATSGSSTIATVPSDI